MPTGIIYGRVGIGLLWSAGFGLGAAVIAADPHDIMLVQDLAKGLVDDRVVQMRAARAVDLSVGEAGDLLAAADTISFFDQGLGDVAIKRADPSLIGQDVLNEYGVDVGVGDRACLNHASGGHRIHGCTNTRRRILDLRGIEIVGEMASHILG